VLLPIHIIAAGLGLLSGAVALAAAKGRLVHRKSGIVFVYAIVAMCATAVVSATVKSQPVNVMAALMTTYLVLTGWWTVRPPSDGSRRRDLGLMLMALTLGLATFTAGLVSVAMFGGRLAGLPAFPFFLFGVLGISGGIGDWKVIRAGALRGKARLARHLWRMCMALFITAASFFSIRARVATIFPAPLTTGIARLVPVLLVLIVMFYWLWRIRARVLPARA
jgi:uncharacterized membrane protein